jgi:hypothetical protein
MRERAWVLGGVIAGVLGALLFSSVVAMGPAPGSIKGRGEAQRSQSEQPAPQPRLSAAKPKDQPPSAGDEAYCEKSPSRPDCIIQLRTARATERQADIAWIALIAVAVTVVFTLGTVIAGFLTVWTMRVTTKQQLRAYVSGGGAFQGEWVQNPATGRVEMKLTLPFTFQVTVNNYGVTPAHVTDVDIGFCNATNIPPVPQYTENVLIGGVIPPGKEGAHTAARFTRGQIEGDVIFGRFQYTDIFRAGVRRTGFILRITADNDVVPIVAPSAYTDWD